MVGLNCLRWSGSNLGTRLVPGVVSAAVGGLLIVGAGCGNERTQTFEEAGDFGIDTGKVSLTVDPRGARITDVHLAGGANLLSGPSADPSNFGSTFWTSPQSLWGWPPPAAFDSSAYTATRASASVEFVGPTDTTFGVSLTKRFSPGGTGSRIDAAYEVTAQTRAMSVAPWEITRVPPGGLTFYPTGTGAPMAGGGFALPPTEDAAGCTWIQDAAAGTDQKLLADGAGGWLAHVAGDTVLVKKFNDIPPGMAAPGEAEIEVFVQGQGAYVEVEEQGAYQAVAQGKSLTWNVTWIVARLPTGMSATLGSADLVAFVQQLVQ